MSVLALLQTVLIGAGVAFFVIGSIGVLRFPVTGNCRSAKPVIPRLSGASVWKKPTARRAGGWVRVPL